MPAATTGYCWCWAWAPPWCVGPARFAAYRPAAQTNGYEYVGVYPVVWAGAGSVALAEKPKTGKPLR
uniref:Uncharacterized protein n=1 Tax=Tanacetum cinerariifolium TaxID=118510 RepID=A0A699W3U0_TANCI|nr:hypothetical protein [Tanacetum cinerariifolium]